MGCAAPRALRDARYCQMMSSPSTVGTASACPPRPARGRRRLCADGRPAPLRPTLVCAPVGERPDSLL